MIAKNKKRKEKEWKDKGITKYISIDIIESVLMHMNPKDAMRLSTICKEWKATTQQCDPTMHKTPWLLNVVNSNYFLHSTIDKDMSFTIKIPNIPPRKLCNWGCFHGWLVLEHHRFSLYNPFTRVRLDLPRHKHGIMDFRYMSSAPTNPDCVILVSHINDLYIWRPGDKTWIIQQNMNVIDYRSILNFQGKFYALDYYTGNLVCFQVAPFRIKIMDVPPPTEFYRVLRRWIYLVESCGELLLVCLIFNLNTSKVYIFKLDFENKTWIKVKSLGDRALFLSGNHCDQHGISISACETGYHRSIYLIDWLSKYVYIMRNRKIKRIYKGLQSDCIPLGSLQVNVEIENNCCIS
ncbi:F-box Kelch-repeat protein [Musa troglodytarum]|uniref:F-box Kelch-repeat protein n=1 Tax=Musa troglodytarum TaxID=320322 RepID=A0A9E7KDK8_9LILI|nr:F-box Kelch-repeat protein [Musa troglodytarum]